MGVLGGGEKVYKSEFPGVKKGGIKREVKRG